MLDDMKLYADLGLTGLFYEGNEVMQTADLTAIRAWVCAQLSWDAGRDSLALANEFLVNYYSAGAAGYIHTGAHARIHR